VQAEAAQELHDKNYAVPATVKNALAAIVAKAGGASASALKKRKIQ
jgi:hypothetical protein